MGRRLRGGGPAHEYVGGHRAGGTVYRPHAGGPVNAKRLVIAGRVQGVGYRAWMTHKAAQLGIAGWVRNRPDGSVEALIAGDVASVEEMSRLCRRGPRLAEVSSINEDLAEPPDDPGFYQV